MKNKLLSTLFFQSDYSVLICVEWEEKGGTREHGQSFHFRAEFDSGCKWNNTSKHLSVKKVTSMDS